MDRHTINTLAKIVQRQRVIAAEVSPVPPMPVSPANSMPAPAPSSLLSWAELEARQQRDRRWELWQKSNVPPRHRLRLQEPIAFKQPQADSVWAIVDARGIAILIGPPGTGKTQLAAAIAKHWVLTGRGTAYYIRAIDLLTKVRNEYDEDGDRQGTTLERMSGFGLLIVDELSAIKTSVHVFEQMTALVDTRYGRSVPTIIISNDTPEQMYQRLGEPMMSRLMETGRMIEVAGEDYRAKAAQAGGGRA